jgi:tRNA-Thr(GGU) m(6)t(6)A37 methyltransferase TsaA
LKAGEGGSAHGADAYGSARPGHGRERRRREPIIVKAGVKDLVVRPIGVVRSPFTELAQAPRQPRAAEGVRGRIELVSGLSLEDAIEDLAGWDYLWVIFWFDRAEGWRPKVQPPRSERKRGVLATRAPHRPNPIGLSVMKIVSVSGLVIEVEDVDVVDGTPVLDLKPYVPWTDAIPSARTGWLEPPEGALPGGERPADPRPTWVVSVSPRADEQLAWLLERGVDLRARLLSALALGPQAHAYRRIKKDERGLRISVKEWHARFVAEGDRIVVTELETGRRASEVGKPGSELHLEFVTRFA